MSRYSVGTYRPSVRTSIGIRTSTLRSSQLGRSSISYLTPKRVSTTVSNLATAFNSSNYSGTLSWETAFTDVVPVLKIQYRNDPDIHGFLTNPDRVRLLTYSSIARMEYNRRCFREELEFETYSPPRARRIAKEVTVDYIRKWVIGEEEKIEMFSRIDAIKAERDSVVAQVIKVEDENLDLRREKDRLIIKNSEEREAKELVAEDLKLVAADLEDANKNLDEVNLKKKDLELTLSNTEDNLNQVRVENQNLRDDIEQLKKELSESKASNDSLRNECQQAYNQSNQRRDEISQLKSDLESERAANARASALADNYARQNEELKKKNEALNEKNLSLRDAANVFRAREEEMRTLVNIQSSILTHENTEKKEE